MTIGDIIESNEQNIENLEEMTQIPPEERNELVNLFGEITTRLGEFQDLYGDDPSDIVDEDTVDEDY